MRCKTLLDTPVRTIIESPFMPTEDQIVSSVFSRKELFRQNIIYARLLLADSLERGEAPFASHLLYTQVWSEVRREDGLRAAFQWMESADQVVAGIDLGISSSMQRGIQNAKSIGIPSELRRVWPEDKTIQQIRELLHEEHLEVGFSELESASA